MSRAVKVRSVVLLLIISKCVLSTNSTGTCRNYRYLSILSVHDLLMSACFGVVLGRVASHRGVSLANWEWSSGFWNSFCTSKRWNIGMVWYGQPNAELYARQRGVGMGFTP